MTYAATLLRTSRFGSNLNSACRKSFLQMSNISAREPMSFSANRRRPSHSNNSSSISRIAFFVSAIWLQQFIANSLRMLSGHVRRKANGTSSRLDISTPVMVCVGEGYITLESWLQ